MPSKLDQTEVAFGDLSDCDCRSGSDRAGITEVMDVDIAEEPMGDIVEELLVDTVVELMADTIEKLDVDMPLDLET